MKKIVFSALALSLVAGSGMASEDEWTELDEAVEAMAAALAQGEDGAPSIWGYIRVNYMASPDVEASVVDPSASTGDYGGFAIPEARIAVVGNVNDYAYKVQYDFSQELIKDAYVRFPIGSTVYGQVGNYKSPFLRSGLVSPKNQFFLDSTANGAAWGDLTHQVGAKLGGDFSLVHWDLSLQNGDDELANDYLFTGRLGIDLLGEGISDSGVEGAYGGSEGPSMTASVSYFDDGSVSDGSGFGVDAYLGSNVYWFGAEAVDLNEGGGDLFRYTDGPFLTGTSQIQDDSTPWSLMGTWMMVPDLWEIGVRYQDLDNSGNETSIELGVNRYLSGHNLKWGIYGKSTDADVAADEYDLFGVQLVAGF